MDEIDIFDVLPHRYPFLLIDKIVSYGPKHVHAVKLVSANEPYFEGHFPGLPIMPGVLIGEALAQAAAFIGQPEGSETQADPVVNRRGFLVRTDLTLRSAVRPGDRLELRVKLKKKVGRMAKFTGSAFVGKEEVGWAEFSLVEFRDQSN